MCQVSGFGVGTKPAVVGEAGSVTSRMLTPAGPEVADVQVVTAVDLLVLHLEAVGLPVHVGPSDDLHPLCDGVVEDGPADADRRPVGVWFDWR